MTDSSRRKAPGELLPSQTLACKLEKERVTLGSGPHDAESCFPVAGFAFWCADSEEHGDRIMMAEGRVPDDLVEYSAISS